MYPCFHTSFLRRDLAVEDEWARVGSPEFNARAGRGRQLSTKRAAVAAEHRLRFEERRARPWFSQKPTDTTAIKPPELVEPKTTDTNRKDELARKVEQVLV